LREPWLAAVQLVLDDATLALPGGVWMHGANGRGGKQGVHTEHLGHVLTEMQHLQRAYPGAQW
jgi:ring-1,2-phenylacetyl-CoA epoxidase subunit PaaC